ncbi:MAG: hypothetical protein NC122_03525 [Faecalibacterium sp.]|nr:hypothetical protein [Ruminococcus sp.]MCM1391488.1 hypothetical protein [Ruminococcus sp.]MCM1485254.1 hypothetical protein [Faecalibacterium sp.]
MDAKKIYKYMKKNNDIVTTEEEKQALETLYGNISLIKNQTLEEGIVDALSEVRKIENAAAFEQGFKTAVSLILNS